MVVEASHGELPNLEHRNEEKFEALSLSRRRPEASKKDFQNFQTLRFHLSQKARLFLSMKCFPVRSCKYDYLFDTVQFNCFDLIDSRSRVRAK